MNERETTINSTWDLNCKDYGLPVVSNVSLFYGWRLKFESVKKSMDYAEIVKNEKDFVRYVANHEDVGGLKIFIKLNGQGTIEERLCLSQLVAFGYYEKRYNK